LDSVEDWINEQKWHNIFTIPINKIHYDLVTEFGKITITDVKANYDTYIALQGRDGQNDYFSYLDIMGFLSETARARVSLMKSDYMISKNGSGPLLLCTIIKLAYVIKKKESILTLPHTCRDREPTDAPGRSPEGWRGLNIRKN
jgi:hypothetical protein